MVFPQIPGRGASVCLGNSNKKTRTSVIARAGPSASTRFSKLVKRLQAEHQIGALTHSNRNPTFCGRPPISSFLLKIDFF